MSRVRPIVFAVLCVCLLAPVRYPTAGRGPVMRAPTTAAAAFVLPGFDQSLIYIPFTSWTNATGVVPDESIGATNGFWPDAGAAQPTYTNFGGGSIFCDGGDSGWITNIILKATNCTWSYWFWPTSTNGDMVHFSWAVPTGYSGCEAGYPTNGVLTIYPVCSYARFAIWPPYPPSNWTHVLTSTGWDGANATMNIYTNGYLAHSSVSTRPQHAPSGKIFIGKYYGGGYNFKGYLSQFYVTETTVSTSQATSIYNNQKGAKGL